MADASDDSHLNTDHVYFNHGHRRNHSGVESIAISPTDTTTNNNNIIGHSAGGRRSSSSTSHSHQARTLNLKDMFIFYRRRLLKLAIALAFLMLLFGVYVEFFKHPPPDVLLVMNNDGNGVINNFGANAFQKSSDEEDGEVAELGDCEEDENCDTEGRPSVNIRDPSEVEGSDYWEKFLKRNHFVPIGAVYDKCENWGVQYGTVILMEDKEFGGVKSRTFINITLDQELSTGQFNIEVKYNGQDLYDNYWDICEMEDDLPPENKTFVCPVKAGHHSKVKDRHVPVYLPTGRYQTKAWAMDEFENVIACGYADFKL